MADLTSLLLFGLLLLLLVLVLVEVVWRRSF